MRSQGVAGGGGTKINKKNEGKGGGLARGAAGVEDGVGGEGGGGGLEAEVGVDPSEMAGAGSNNGIDWPSEMAGTPLLDRAKEELSGLKAT
jgi:hypothetical protein